MRSPTTALVWEIWQRGRRYACFALAALSFCAFFNLLAPERVRASGSIKNLYAMLTVLSFLSLFGFFNYTEINSNREWSGFPYRLFALPIRTWKLVTLPLLFGVACIELFYLGWINLVWTHAAHPLVEWFAVVLAAYVVFYQTALWTLSGLRIARVVIAGLGGTSIVLVACLPLGSKVFRSPWFSLERLIPIAIALALLAFLISWFVVARQRCGGGRSQNRFKNAIDHFIDVLPRRTKSFATPAAAQFWYEWRRIGFLLPLCVAFVLLFIVTPIACFNWRDAAYTAVILRWLLATPVVLAFAVGKGFSAPDFWTTRRSLPSFLAVRPMTNGDFIVCKMKTAVFSTIIAWLLVIGFAALWIPFGANTADLDKLVYFASRLYPHSWWLLIVLCIAGLVLFTWRCLVNGMWAGMSGTVFYPLAAFFGQVGLPVFVLIACGVWSDRIDALIKTRPDVVKSVALTILGWLLCLLVIGKMCLAAIAWSKLTPRRTRQYLLIWSGVTACSVGVAILSTPWADTYRLEHLFVLAALLAMPLARLGFAPLSLARNRHG